MAGTGSILNSLYDRTNGLAYQNIPQYGQAQTYTNTPSPTAPTGIAPTSPLSQPPVNPSPTTAAALAAITQGQSLGPLGMTTMYQANGGVGSDPAYYQVQNPNNPQYPYQDYVYTGDYTGSNTGSNWDYGSTPQAAEQSWVNQYDPTSSANTSATGSNTSQSVANQLNTLLTPQPIFPSGVPQASASTINQVPTSNLNLSNPAYASSILTSMQPQFQSQDQAMQNSLAAQGVVGGATTSQLAQLQAQQQQQYQGAIQPELLQQEGLALNQNQGNASNTMSALTTNANAQNAMNQYNTGNQISNAQFNSTQQAQDATNLSQLLYNQWAQSGDWQYGLSTGAAQGQTGAYQPVYQQPQPVNFSSLGSSFAPTPTYTSNGPTVDDGSGDGQYVIGGTQVT